MQAGARHDVSIQRACIRAVSELLSFDTDMGGFEALPAVMGAMAAHPDDISIQFLGFSFLTALACKFPASDRWFMAVLGVASLAATAMKVGRGNESMQKKGYRLIQMLAESVVSLSSAAESEEAAKTGYEEKAKTASSAVQPLRFLDRLKSFVQSPAWAASNVLPTFIKTFREVINAIFGAFKSPGLNLQDIKQHCLEILRKHTSNEVAELMFSSTLAYVSTACSGQGDLGDWPEAFVAVLEAVEAFPSSSAVQQEGLAALTALLGGPVFKALCRSSQTLRFFHNAQESGACLSLDRLTSALVKVAVNFPRELQLLEVSMKVLLKVRDEDALKDSYSWRVISTSRYLEQQAGRTSHSFFVSTYVPAQTHAELLPPGPRFAPWTTSFDTTASSKSSPSHPLWSVSNILEQFEGGLTTRSLSQYWHRHKAELESKLGHIGQLADWPETPSVPTDLSETASYFQSEAFSVALQTMPPYSRAVVSIFVKLVAYTTVAVAALEAVAKEGATLFGNVRWLQTLSLPSPQGVQLLPT